MHKTTIYTAPSRGGQILGKPMNIIIVHLFTATAENTETEMEHFYEQLRCTRKKETTKIMGDLNTKIGKYQVEDIIGDYGLGIRNTTGYRLVQICQEENFAIMNTWFQMPQRRLYT